MPRRRAKIDREFRSGLLAELLELRDRDDQVDLHATVAHVEHVLRGLGWRTLDPREVARQPYLPNNSMRLFLSLEHCAVAVAEVVSFRSSISTHLQLALVGARPARWLVATNGWTWKIWDSETETLVEEITVDAENAEQRLRLHLSRHSHLTKFLDHRALEQSKRGVVVEKFKQAVLESPSFLEDLHAKVAASGVCLPVEEIREIVTGLFPPDSHRVTADVSEAARTVGARSLARDPQARANADVPGWELKTGVNFPGHGAAQVIWPAEATHVLTRKGCSSFIRFDPATGNTTLLPGSVMRVQTGSSFPSYHRSLREQAIAQGSFRQEEEFLLVVVDYPVETPSTAATLVSGTVANGWTSWRDRDGDDIKRPRKRPSRRMADAKDRAPGTPT